MHRRKSLPNQKANDFFFEKCWDETLSRGPNLKSRNVTYRQSRQL